MLTVEVLDAVKSSSHVVYVQHDRQKKRVITATWLQEFTAFAV
jgi:hypothetical protein